MNPRSNKIALKLNMKKYILHFACITLCSFIYIGCQKSPCITKEELERHPFTEDILQWVNLADTTPLFKISGLDAQGNVISVDTAYNYFYTRTTYDKNIFYPRQDCSQFGTFYTEVLDLMHTNENGTHTYRYFQIKNNDRKDGFSAYIDASSTEDFNESTILDTVTVNNVLYQNVAKSFPTPNQVMYFAKGKGFIYIKITQTVYELIPEN
jgi:hypothetical protein